LAVTRLPPPHTAIKIHDTLNLVLDQWSMPKNKIFRILTDNGSNMVAAFKRHSLGDDSENEDNFTDHDHVTLDPVDFETREVNSDDMSDSDEFDIGLPQPEHNTTTEITEFEDQELNHDLVFTTSYKCVSCFIHTLQLVVKIFEINPSFKSSLQAAYSIVKKVNKSCKATEMLIEKARKNWSVIVQPDGIQHNDSVTIRCKTTPK